MGKGDCWCGAKSQRGWGFLDVFLFDVRCDPPTVKVLAYKKFCFGH